ncbi:class I SAM-dependent methyltransferase [Krasilnikoviella flava]|uniref:Methyltransferase domain-containing protein n=1 Tax=Krasilnikoviella flava TaxID=526729 RepID=A0A1T5IQP5_9MICO|nr:class I SAM-dependent methyltransferase [Krasilnikoviella flava]SKC41263.1 Methyltransferase domain-containing protein [Krasilnikoviella flava]
MSDVNRSTGTTTRITGPGETGPPPASAEDFADRLLGATLGAIDTLAVYVGDALGWYRALDEYGPVTAAELAAATGTAERYAREWLEQQAAAGILLAHEPDPSTDGSPAARSAARRFELPEAHAEVLADPESLSYLAPLARFVGAVGPQLPRLLHSYRTGGGVSWDQLGDDARHAQADVNRPWFDHRLASVLAAIEPVRAVLSRPGARVVDIGCGFGWSTLALARAFPTAELHGVDLDRPSVEAARVAAAQRGLEERVTFHLSDAAELRTAEPFDAAFAFECLHDMPRPVAVLEAIRKSMRPDGVVVVMDEAVADEFQAPADDVDRIMYGYSLFVCLPDSLSSWPSAATGTVMRPATLRRYALEAGFTGVEVLPVDDFGFFRFYRLLLGPEGGRTMAGEDGLPE